MSGEHIYDMDNARWVSLTGNKVLMLAAASDDRSVGYVSFVDAPNNVWKAGVKSDGAADAMGITAQNLTEKAGVILEFDNPTSIITLIHALCDAYEMMLGAEVDS